MESKITLPREWNGWEIREFLGGGSFGKVYRAELAGPDGAELQEAAVKILDIPTDEERPVIERDYPDGSAGIASGLFFPA